MSTTILLPVKKLAVAKQRLAGMLSAGERQDLARAMFLDVCATLSKSVASRVLVYSADSEVLGLARTFGFEDRQEPAPTTHSNAVNQLLPTMIEAGQRTLCVAADLPELRTEESDRLLQASGDSLLILASDDGTGTNALFFRTSKPIPASFGPGSCARHLHLAQTAGLPVEVMRVEGFARDVDTPEDLKAFLRHSTPKGHTLNFLWDSGIAQRVDAYET